MQRLAILGSTGSIGTQTLELMRLHKDEYEVTVLAAGKNYQMLAQQACEFLPKFVYIEDKTHILELKALLPEGTELFNGRLEELCALDCVDTVLVAVVGITGLPAVLESIRCGKKIALANKEALVTGGELVANALKTAGMKIYPVDSEHSAIAQSMVGYRRCDIENIILTASGGPFRTWSKDEIYSATVEQALAHPNWSMGQKVTIDSASMMNKALEVIEARWLFDMPVEHINVVVHPQSIVHSAVEYVDGSVIAQLGTPDMRIPIMYALSMPERRVTGSERLDLCRLSGLTFERPDEDKFPFVAMVRDVLNEGKNASVIFNAANEVAVNAFLNGKFCFGKIFDVVKYAMDTEERVDITAYDDIFASDKVVRIHTQEYIAKM